MIDDAVLDALDQRIARDLADGLRLANVEGTRSTAAELAERVRAADPPQLCPHRLARDGPVRVRLAPGVDVHGGLVPTCGAVVEELLSRQDPPIMGPIMEQLRRATWEAP